ncbi:hypothetical protein [Haloparvum sp. PAK95]|uniref:hypothetical protein n=1 Tax=Haloparvum sp. PAK95 TaxID=3418962 RepID=UPI003D2EBF3E
MQRRRYLKLGAVGLTTAAAGCTADGGGPSTATPTGTDPERSRVTGEEPTLAPGEYTQVRVSATQVTGLHLGVPIDEDAVEFSISGADVSPTPDRQLDSYPPKWQWDQCVDAEAVVSLTVADDAEAGEYTYSVAATLCGTDRDDVERESTVTVTGD